MRHFVAIARALSDESRVRMLMLLRDGELCLCQIIELIGLAPSTVSRHMTVLWQAGLVEIRKSGTWRYYRIPESENSAAVSGALHWAQIALLKSPELLRDAKARKTIVKMDSRDLCARYKRRNSGEHNG